MEGLFLVTPEYSGDHVWFNQKIKLCKRCAHVGLAGLDVTDLQGQTADGSSTSTRAPNEAVLHGISMLEQVPHSALQTLLDTCLLDPFGLSWPIPHLSWLLPCYVLFVLSALLLAACCMHDLWHVASWFPADESAGRFWFKSPKRLVEACRQLREIRRIYRAQYLQKLAEVRNLWRTCKVWAEEPVRVLLVHWI